jgi:hypothetical protein
MILGLENKTRGLVYGPPLLSTPWQASAAFVRDGRSITISDCLVPVSWAPVVNTYKLTIRDRHSGEVIWMRPFADRDAAFYAWARLLGVDLDHYAPGTPVRLPCWWIEGDLEFWWATVTTFNATNTDNTNDWAAGGNLVPSGVSSVDYLVIAGGGGGGSTAATYASAGGGGAGGYRADTGLAVTPGASVTVTVGAGGNAGTAGSTGDVGDNGSNSVFSSITSTGGGGGAGAGSSNPTTPGNGGSGGGGTPYNINVHGTGTGGQGNNGGDAQSLSGNYGAGGGGGASAVGGNGNSSTAGAGGAGTSSSISGSAVTRGGGGGGGIVTGSGGAGGSGGGGAGGGGVSAVNAVNGTANTGGGGGGNGTNGSVAVTAGNGGSGVIILSWTAGSGSYVGSGLIGGLKLGRGAPI